MKKLLLNLAVVAFFIFPLSASSASLLNQNPQDGRYIKAYQHFMIGLKKSDWKTSELMTTYSRLVTSRYIEVNRLERNRAEITESGDCYVFMVVKAQKALWIAESLASQLYNKNTELNEIKAQAQAAKEYTSMHNAHSALVIYDKELQVVEASEKLKMQRMEENMEKVKESLCRER